MAAYAAVASLLNNIEQIMIHRPHFSASLNRNQIQALHEKAGLLLEFIEGYNYGGLVSQVVEDLERRIASAAHEAEDVIESRIVDDQIHAGSTEISLSCSLHLQQIALHMDAILEGANELKEKEDILRLREEQPTPTNSRPVLLETAMIGFEEEVVQIMDELTNPQSSRRIISIVGMGGTGKTTLAHNLYQNSLINHHFHIRAWAAVSQQYNIKEIFSQLLGSKCDSGEELHRFLYGRKYLIILDDIWSVEAWDKVSLYFPDNGNGSRVVLTTRLSNVARDCVSSYCLTMRPLDEDKCWELFCKKAFGKENCPYPELEEAGKEIARLCRGLPLSTVVVGGLLRKSPRSLQFWEKVLSNIESNPNSKEKEESLDILSLSYTHLPPHLKPCFLYMGVFKEDSKIHVPNIIQLWVAEGFIRSNKSRFSEEVAEGYLKDLIDRNLILVTKHRKNGTIGYCGIHDLVRDLCLKVGEQQEFFHMANNGGIQMQGKERRIISRGLQHTEEYTEPLLTRSIFHDYQNRSLVNRTMVRVLDQVVVQSGAEIYGNVNLRYISCNYSNFRHTLLWELPTSVSYIWNLQTLIIRGTLVVAPIEIWKMRQLRHVQCTNIYVPDSSDIGLCTMDNLQTLTRAVNMRVSEQVCEIIPNIKDLYLHYDSMLHGYDGSLIESVSYLDRLHKLESLKLSFHSRIYGELNKKLAFPISLNKLSLSDCRVRLEDLWLIGSLPQLEVLHIHGYNGEEWRFIEGQFLRLKVLRLECFNVGKWEADKSHFPVLEKLLLERLWELEEISLDVGEIPTLELIRVDNCTESAAISAVKIKEDQLENQGNDALKIQLRMFDSKLESFKERVEKEGLTIDDIELEIHI